MFSLSSVFDLFCVLGGTLPEGFHPARSMSLHT